MKKQKSAKLQTPRVGASLYNGNIWTLTNISFSDDGRLENIVPIRFYPKLSEPINFYTPNVTTLIETHSTYGTYCLST